MKTASNIPISGIRADPDRRVIASDDPGYDDARGVFSTGFDRRPAAVVRVADASDVSRVVDLARETGAELAVRRGGHGRARYGTSEGGIVLDLSEMNGVEIDAEGRTAWAQVAIAVDDHWQGRGIGRRLLDALFDCARGEGVTRLLAYVDSENHRLLGWIARAGGVAQAHHGDASVYRIALYGPTRVGSGAS